MLSPIAIADIKTRPSASGDVPHNSLQNMNLTQPKNLSILFFSTLLITFILLTCNQYIHEWRQLELMSPLPGEIIQRLTIA